jgi:catechol 2,3-dioxygenase-like lactoylglutathione lyase family enzyme
MKLITGLFAAVCAFAQLPKGEITMGHLHLTVTDPQAHKKLWIGVLGAEVVRAGSLELLKLPDVIVALTGGAPGGGTDDSAVNHLGFLVKDLAAMKEKLTAAGGQVVREMPATKQMFVMFPDGVKVEFTEDAALAVPVRHHHIHFFTHDLEATRAWYVKHFGAKPGKRGRFEAADLPGVNLSFSPTEKPTVATRGRAMDHIGFEIKNLEAFCKKLESEGVKFDRPYRYIDALGLSVAFLTDPFGVRVELTEGLGKL